MLCCLVMMIKKDSNDALPCSYPTIGPDLRWSVSKDRIDQRKAGATVALLFAVGPHQQPIFAWFDLKHLIFLRARFASEARKGPRQSIQVERFSCLIIIHEIIPVRLLAAKDIVPIFIFSPFGSRNCSRAEYVIFPVAVEVMHVAVRVFARPPKENGVRVVGRNFKEFGHFSNLSCEVIGKFASWICPIIRTCANFCQSLFCTKRKNNCPAGVCCIGGTA